MSPKVTGSFLNLPASLKIQVIEKPNFEVIDPGKMDAIFEDLCQHKPLFNGSLLCIDPSNFEKLSAYPLSFKEYSASKHLANYPVCHIPLAVSGWILYKEALLFGVRSMDVFNYPGLIELVPSGGVDASAQNAHHEVLYKEALLQELEEETGIAPSFVDHMKAHALYYCREKHVLDICLSITLKEESPIELMHNEEEYSHLFWVPLQALSSFLQLNRQNMLPLTAKLIEKFILSPASHD